jgi:hypothetical protein
MPLPQLTIPTEYPSPAKLSPLSPTTAVQDRPANLTVKEGLNPLTRKLSAIGLTINIAASEKDVEEAENDSPTTATSGLAISPNPMVIVEI